MNTNDGCLAGLFKLLLLNWVFDFLQENFGFGRGCSCGGCGCGLILLIIFIGLACSIVMGTDWSRWTMEFVPLFV